MNHLLAVYTVVYVAILFVTVSIWGSGIGSAAGDNRILLAGMGAFSLKLAIDDYVHFQGETSRLELDLPLSLLIYILLATSIAMAASNRLLMATALFATMFLACSAWILSSGLRGPSR